MTTSERLPYIHEKGDATFVHASPAAPDRLAV